MKQKVFLLLVGLILATAAAVDARAGDKSIADLESNLSKYQNKTVKITGVVRDADGVNIPLLGVSGGCYKIDDGTGSIWVCTERGVPVKGTQVRVKGVLQTGAVIRGKNYGLMIIEKDRKFRKR
ncbi:MAG TPA: hypothetical protein VIL74_13340 [Pyrinomonadaceae bacterium]|jgi:hypothetical protein